MPRVVHFVFGLREQREPFHPVHYLAVESARRVLAPERIYLHHRHLPWGVYWDLLRPHLTLVEVDLAPEVLDGPRDERRIPERFRYAHHADFVRLDALLEHGGVYADIDTLWVRPLPDVLWQRPFVIGAEAPVRDELTGEVRPSLCNAVLLAEPGASFARDWRAGMAAAMNGTWSNHSGFLPRALADAAPDTVHVEPRRSFHRYAPTAADLALLLEGDDTDAGLAGVHAVHLCSHLWWEAGRHDVTARTHAGTLTEEHLRAGTTTYSRLARGFLPELDLW